MAVKQLHITAIDGRHLTIPVRECEEIADLEQQAEDLRHKVKVLCDELQAQKDFRVQESDLLIKELRRNGLTGPKA